MWAIHPPSTIRYISSADHSIAWLLFNRTWTRRWPSTNNIRFTLSTSLENHFVIIQSDGLQYNSISELWYGLVRSSITYRGRGSLAMITWLKYRYLRMPKPYHTILLCEESVRTTGTSKPTDQRAEKRAARTIKLCFFFLHEFNYNFVSVCVMLNIFFLLLLLLYAVMLKL